MRAGGYAQLLETLTTAQLRHVRLVAGVRCGRYRSDLVLTTSQPVPFAVTRTGS